MPPTGMPTYFSSCAPRQTVASPRSESVFSQALGSFLSTGTGCAGSSPSCRAPPPSARPGDAANAAASADDTARNSRRSIPAAVPGPQGFPPQQSPVPVFASVMRAAV
jgi:hypothetical protein